MDIEIILHKKSSDTEGSLIVMEGFLLSAVVDEISRWWSAVARVAVHWLKGDLSAAEKVYPAVDTLPRELQESE